MKVEKVYAVSGALITGNLGSIGNLSEALKSGEEQVVVVTGAGELKEYIEAAGEFGNQGEQDLVGIAATRLNAKTLMTAMDAFPDTPKTAEGIRKAVSTGQDVVMGGLTPGHSTDAVGAIAAEILEADLYIASTVDGVYDRPPEEGDAEKFDRINTDQLREVVSGNNEAGGHELIDLTAIDIIERSDTRTKIFEGSIDNIENPEKADGTVIEP